MLTRPVDDVSTVNDQPQVLLGVSQDASVSREEQAQEQLKEAITWNES